MNVYGSNVDKQQYINKKKVDYKMLIDLLNPTVWNYLISSI